MFKKMVVVLAAVALLAALALPATASAQVSGGFGVGFSEEGGIEIAGGVPEGSPSAGAEGMYMLADGTMGRLSTQNPDDVESDENVLTITGAHLNMDGTEAGVFKVVITVEDPAGLGGLGVPAAVGPATIVLSVGPDADNLTEVLSVDGIGGVG